MLLKIQNLDSMIEVFKYACYKGQCYAKGIYTSALFRIEEIKVPLGPLTLSTRGDFITPFLPYFGTQHSMCDFFTSNGS